MKFTKEEAYKHLVGVISKEGQTLNISERSINEMLDTLIPLLTNDETELNSFVTSVVPLFKTSEANIKNDVSHGINKYKEENPVINTDKTQKDKAAPSLDAALLARLEALEQKNRDAENAQKLQNVKTSLTAKIKELGVSNDKWIETMLGNSNINIDVNIDSKAQEYLELYNSMFAGIEPSVTPRSTGGGKNDYIGDTIAAAAEFAKQQSMIG